MTLDEVLDRRTKEQRTLYPSLDDAGKLYFWERACLEDFPTLVYILGYHDTGNFHIKEMEHIAEFRRLTDKPVRRIWLWARGHFKTSLISEAHSIDLILNNPDIRILIVSNTLDVSKKILSNIKSHFIGNNNFRSIFPKFCPKANKDGKVEFGTTEYFTVPNRTRHLKEPTCMIAGVGTNLTGLHFDVMIIDDLVTLDSVTNDTQIQASKDYYASLRQLFDNPTIPREEVIGTTYHFSDLYSELKIHPEFEKSIIPVLRDGSPTFPERFSVDGINAILNDPSVGPRQFYSQYMLNPVNPADSVFNNDWLVYYTPNELPYGYEFILVDPASTQKKKSDYTVIQHWLVDATGTAWLKNGIRDKLTSYQRIDKLLLMVKSAQNLKYVKYETLGGRHGDLEVIEQKKREQGIDFFVREVRATNASKRDRIEQRLVGQYHARKVRLPLSCVFKSVYDGKVYNFTELLKMEYLQFPHTEHDDILDCQSFLYEEQLIKPRSQRMPRDINKKPTADEEDREYQAHKSLLSAYPMLTQEQARDRMFYLKLRKMMSGA